MARIIYLPKHKLNILSRLPKITIHNLRHRYVIEFSLSFLRYQFDGFRFPCPWLTVKKKLIHT